MKHFMVWAAAMLICMMITACSSVEQESRQILQRRYRVIFFRGNTGEKFAVCNARAVRFIRKNADVYGIDPDAIAVMGKSIDR